VKGEVVSLSGGKYKVKSPSLGTVSIDESKVCTISKIDEAAESSKEDTDSLDSARIQIGGQKLRSTITGNEDIMKLVSGLISNLDLQALLNDPAILNAAKSMDIQTLLANEKFVNVVNDPKVKDVVRKIKGQND